MMNSFNLDLIFSFAMASLITTMMLISVTDNSNNTVSTSIEYYLESFDFQAPVEGEVAIFSDFLVKDNGDFITVDFMVEEDGQVTILSEEFDEEYYLFETYSSQSLTKHTSPTVLITPAGIPRT